MRMNCFWSLAAAGALFAAVAQAEPKHGIAMYGEPALPPDFVSLPHVNLDAPKGGAIVQGETGSFDSLNPHIRKGRVPWQLRFLAYESLLGRNYDEPFTLYGLLAESVEVPEDRSWVEFTLNPAAEFSDGSPVTVEDVLWSFETLGTQGHPRYAGTWEKVESAEAVGERTVRFTFNTRDDELPLIMGLRPILKKAQWDGVDFAESGLDTVPISSAPYVITDFDPGRFVLLERNPDYWGADIPLRRGTNNLDQIRMEFFADGTAMFEAFKGGVLNTMRETNVQKWDTLYDFPAVDAGDVVKSIIPHQRPAGLQGLAINTRRDLFADWRVREALITAFNFEFINTTINGDPQPRIDSVFANSVLGMEPGAPAEGKVAEILAAHADDLLPGAMEGYALPTGDGTERNRGAIRTALGLMEEAGWTLQDGTLKNANGDAFTFEILLQTGAAEPQQIVDIYLSALERMGIFPKVESADSAQFKERTNVFDFDMIWYRRGVSLSPGNEQALYWGSDAADVEGSRNVYGIKSPAIDAVIDGMLTSASQEDYRAGVKALDRLLMSGRYFIPIWHSPIARLAHAKELKYRADRLPMYGDWIGFQPDVWWYEE